MGAAGESGRHERYARLARAGSRVPEWEGAAVQGLFAPAWPPISDELRARAFEALDSLLAAVAERLLRKLEVDAQSVDVTAVIARVQAGPAMRTAEIASALVQRAEEHVIARRLRDASLSLFPAGEDAGLDEPDLVTGMLDSEDDELAAAAAAFSDMQAYRVDEHGRLLLLPEELPVDTAAHCYWAMAAAIGDGRDRDFARTLSQRVRAQLARHDVVRAPQHRAMKLAVRLEERGEVNGRLLIRLAAAGEALLLAAAVAVLAGITSGTAWLLLMRSERAATMSLLKALGLSRARAAQLAAIVDFGASRASSFEQALQRSAQLYDDTDAELAADLLAWWRIDPGYRAASGVAGC